ncbi:MAG: aldo/keto reductase [Candidatus Firestonebacteria bacterium]
MEKRAFGKTGEKLSVAGFGGMLVMQEPQATADRMVAEAVEKGINYFDVAPTYGDAEEKLAAALLPHRKSVFLACKTAERSAKGAEKELTQSLKRFKTDRLDLYQLHAVNTAEELGEVLAPGGALEFLLKAKQRGLLRFLGFSSHHEHSALALFDSFAFDSCMFPLNFFCWHYAGLGKKLVKKAAEKGAGLNALKTLAKTKRPAGKYEKWNKCWYEPLVQPEDIKLAVRFTLSLPVTSALSSSHEELFKLQCEASNNALPLTEAEEAFLKNKYAGLEPLFK